MRFLFDENMPPSFCAILQDLGHEAIHVYDVKLNQTPDNEIVIFAEENNYIIITNDLDFSRIIATGSLMMPSVITFRFPRLNKSIFLEIMSLNLVDLADSLLEGSLVTIDDKKIRIQTLPVNKR
jgi:predicted nuclease of predicted toxin-antitoxin system